MGRPRWTISTVVVLGEAAHVAWVVLLVLWARQAEGPASGAAPPFLTQHDLASSHTPASQPAVTPGAIKEGEGFQEL